MRKLRSLQWIHDRFQHCRCAPDRLTSYAKTAPAIARAIRACGLTMVGRAFHQFDKGYTSVWLLKQSHLSIHSWPEYGFVTLSLELCNFSAADQRKSGKLYRTLVEFFKPARRFPSRRLRKI